MKENKLNFKKALKDELDKLQDFCNLYDSGKISYYKEMSVIFRKLFYDNNHNISLLKHLNQKENIKLLSFSGTKSNIDEEMFFMGMGIIKNGRYVPNYEEGIIKKLLNVKDYLEEVVFIYNGNEYNRFDIFISVSNQDGGAHYDKELNPKYKLLKEANFVLKIPFFGNFRIDNIVGTIIRQMGYEILNSKDIYFLYKD